MAKRKAAGGSRKAVRKSSGTRTGATRRTAAAKTTRKSSQVTKTARGVTKTARRGTKAARRATASRPATGRTAARTTTKPATPRRPTPKAITKARPSAKAVKRSAKPVRRSVKPSRSPATGTSTRKTSSRVTAKAKSSRTPARKATTTPRSAPPARRRDPVTAVAARKAPSLDRERRTIPDSEEDEMMPSPPSSLDLDRTASAARSGRRQVQQRFSEHTETSPAMTAGDVDADWESAYSVGDEAPGGDNPTPDQDIVDDIGRAVGVQYEDNEELKGADKVAKRDEHRWELDPASAEDWDDRE